MAQMDPIRVAVIAESPPVRASLQALVEASPALRFAGSAAQPDMLADCIAGSVPNVVVIDVEPEASDAPRAEFDLARTPSTLVLLTDEAAAEVPA